MTTRSGISPSWAAPAIVTHNLVVELRAGTSDVYGLDGVAAQYGMLLNERGVPTTIVLEPGGHDWGYWRGAMRASSTRARARCCSRRKSRAG